MSKNSVVRTTQCERSGGRSWYVLCVKEDAAEVIKLLAITKVEQQVNVYGIY